MSTSEQQKQREQADLLYKDRKCLVCQKKIGNDGEYKMGLCVAHYTEYYRQSRPLSAKDKIDFEEYMYERGLLMPRRYAKLINSNPIAEAFNDFMASRTDPIAEAIADADAIIDADSAAGGVSQRKTKKKPNNKAG